MGIIRRNEIHDSSRRRFAGSLALAAATPFLPHSGTAAGPAPAPGGAQAPGDQLISESDALTQLVRIRYGKQLSEEQLNALKRNVEDRLKDASVMKQFKLANGDEPAFVFSPEPK